MNALLQFPARGGDGQKPAPLRPTPVVETFDPDRARELHEVAGRLLGGAAALADFIHSSRGLAAMAGVETIGIEVSMAASGDGLLRVLDELESAVREGRPAGITKEGTGALKRLETLLAEAHGNMRRFVDGDFSVMESIGERARMEADRHRAKLGFEERRVETMRQELSLKEDLAGRHAAAADAYRSDMGLGPSRTGTMGRTFPASDALWIPLAILGVVSVAVVAVVLASKKS